MTKALSLYLDALRFAAALTVFLSHYATGRISGGLLWNLADYGRTAVLVFFVLSGFVIAWVSETRERTLADFALSRIARLYSVMIPVFILTAALDGLGKAIDPWLYDPQWSNSLAHPVLGYVLSTVFLGESWNLSVLPGFNVPFWSLNYEAWYYALFGAAMFLRGPRRITAMGLAALLAGPKVLLLLPVWLMGVCAWHWRAALHGQWAALLAFASLAGLIALEVLGGQQLFQHSTSPWLPPGYSGYDYVLGALVALLIASLANLRLPLPSTKIQYSIRGLAGTSFGLYLLHYPLLNFFGTVIPGSPEEATHRALVFAFALGAAIGVAALIEPRKTVLKRRLQKGTETLLGRRPAPTYVITEKQS